MPYSDFVMIDAHLQLQFASSHVVRRLGTAVLSFHSALCQKGRGHLSARPPMIGHGMAAVDLDRRGGSQCNLVEMSISHEFSDNHVDLAIKYVITHGAEDRAKAVSYSLVFAAAGLPSPQNLHQGGETRLVTEFMARFHFRCLELNLPPLDSLVVHVAGQRENFPGAGYFRVNNHADPLGNAIPEAMIAATRFWEDQKKQCKDWGIRSRRGQAPPIPWP